MQRITRLIYGFVGWLCSEHHQHPGTVPSCMGRFLSPAMADIVPSALSEMKDAFTKWTEQERHSQPIFSHEITGRSSLWSSAV